MLAHPGSIETDQLIPRLIERGLQGIEVFCLKHTNAQIEHYTQLAAAKGLLITGGSDFHNAVDTIYDAILGATPLADQYVEKLKAAAEKMKAGQVGRA